MPQITKSQYKVANVKNTQYLWRDIKAHMNDISTHTDANCTFVQLETNTCYCTFVLSCKDGHNSNML